MGRKQIFIADLRRSKHTLVLQSDHNPFRGFGFFWAGGLAKVSVLIAEADTEACAIVIK